MSDDIVADNVRAFGPIYFAAMLDEMKAFRAADRLVELFQTGVLPIASRNDLIEVVRARIDADARMTEAERRGWYSRALGTPGGAPASPPNREFAALWRRLMVAVAELIECRAQAEAGDAAAAMDALRGAARALAHNLSTHGAGLREPAAEMVKQIDVIVRLLSDPQIRSAYGVRNLWQVIESVSKAELGGARHVDRYQSLATSGRTIIDRLARGGGDAVDAELVAACETWIAVTGTPDAVIEDLSKPTWSD